MWQLLRHSAPGVPAEALLQSRYIMGAAHPAEGWRLEGLCARTPTPRPAETPSLPQGTVGGEEAPVFCSRSAPRQLSFPLTHELRERPGFARCPLPHRPHPDLSTPGQACGLCCAPQASSAGENGASCQGHCGGRKSHRGLHVNVQRSGGSVDSAVRTTGPLMVKGPPARPGWGLAPK